MQRRTLTSKPVDPEITALAERHHADPEAILAILQELQARHGGLTRAAIARDPAAPLHKLNLARVLVLSGAKAEAIEVLRGGMHDRHSPELAEELERLGLRRPPVFGFLRRGNLVNRAAGLLFTRLGLRR
jgi:hypothetical protein